MNEKRWNAVRQFYVESFGINPDVVDLMASNEILLMCVSGASNRSISLTLNMDESDVQEIISTILDFSGWTVDLDVNPLKIYSSLGYKGGYRRFTAFYDEMTKLYFTVIDDKKIQTMFRTCRVYEQIAQRLDAEWK
jgi:hypothetical protein